MSRTYKLFLCVQPTSLEMARYIDSNIEDINRTGVRIQIEKINMDEIDDDMRTTLARKGINRMPAMIDATGRVYIGLKQIRGVFENRTGRAAMDSRFSPPMESGAGVSPDLPADVASYWQRELFSGADMKGGKLTFNDERNDDDALRDDIHRRIAEQQQKSSHRRQQPNNRDRQGDSQRGQPTRVSSAQDDHQPIDNISNDMDMGFTRRDPIGNMESPEPSGDAVDDQMLKAWMQNNIQ